MHFIKQLMEGEPAPWIHRRFIRYGRGEYEGASLKINNKGKSLTVTGTLDYVGLMGELISSLKVEKVDVKGKIFCWEGRSENQ